MVNYNYLFNAHIWGGTDRTSIRGGHDPTLPKVDGRLKDADILKLANTTSNECVNEQPTCMNATLKSVVSYYVNKHEDQISTKRKKKLKTDFDKAKELLECDTEACVLTRPEFVKSVVEDNIISDTSLKKYVDTLYKPPGDVSNNPQMGGAWGSILQSLFNWTSVYKDFMVIVAKDLKCTTCPTRVDIHDFVHNLELVPTQFVESLEAYPYKNKFGTIFNNVTDRTEGMEHAVVMFIDCSSTDGPWTVEFFNSHGTQPEKAISLWMEKTKLILQAYRKDKFMNDDVITVVASNIQHQGNSIECSLYSQFYIKCRLENVPYSFFRKNVIPAESMIQFRKHVFRNANYQIK